MDITMDPPGALIDGDVVSDVTIDSIHEVTDDSVDIVSVEMVENIALQTTVFSHKGFFAQPPKGVYSREQTIGTHP
jgi:hypothetical protein